MISRDTIKKTGSTFAHLALSMAALSGGANSYYQTKRQGGLYTPAKEMVARLNAKPLSATAIQNSKWQKSLDPVVNKNTNGLELKKTQQARELIIVDGAVEDKHVIFKQAQSGVDIVEIPEGKDGMVELMKILSNYSNLDAVHIVSHAKAGSIQMGGQTIDQKELEEDVAGFAAINNAIRKGGDLMLYGCDVAKDKEGDEFLEIIQNNTHVDVAASNDQTGNEAYGGNWELEIQKGDIEATPLPESIAMKDFTGTLQFTGTIDFSQVKDGGAFGGPEGTDASFYTSAAKEYLLVADGESYSTYAFGSALYVGGFYFETSVKLHFSNNESFNPGSLFFDTGVTGTGDFIITSDKGDSKTVPNQRQTVDLSSFADDVTWINISSAGSGFNLILDDFEVADVGGNTNNPPKIGGTSVGQNVNDNATISPFSSLTITDDDGDNVSATITLDDNAKGTLSGTGLSGSGPYTISSTSAADLQTKLRALVFNPTDNRTSTSETTIFTLEVNDGMDTDTDNTTTVISSAVAPTVSTVSVPSNGTYVAGQNLDFSANFNENITVDTAGGTPQISLTIGSTTRQAIYLSGSGTSSLVFRYTVQNGDEDSDGISVGSLSINGGTLRDSGGKDANLTLNNVGNTSSVLVDAVDPTVSSVSVPSNGTYVTGQNLDFTANFNENVTVNTTGGTPQISLNIGSTTRQATYVSGSGTSALVFRYTVQSGDNDSDGIAVGSLSANGGTIRDGAGNNANLTLNSVGNTSSVLVDAAAPSVSSVAVPSNGTYTLGQNLDFTINFDENVSINTAGGTPQMSLTIGSVTRQATYVSGSGTSSLIFRYTIQNGDEDSDGIAIGSLSANGGTLQDSGGNDVNLSLNNVGSTSSVLVDAIAPTISEVTAVTTPTNDTTPDYVFSTDETGAMSVGGSCGTSSSTEINSSGNQTITLTQTDNSTVLSDATYSDCTITVTDDAGNSSDALAISNFTIDTAAPAGYTVSIDQDPINASNDEAVSFTFASAEVGATYNYTFSSSGGGTNVTGSGTISTARDQVTGIDVSGLGDGTITLAVTLTDGAGNAGSAATDTETKYTASNSAPVLGNLDGDNVSLQPGEIRRIDNDHDATVTDADSPDFNGGFLEIQDKGGDNSVNGNFSVDGTNATSGGDGTIAAGETIAVGGTGIGTIDATNDGQGGNNLTITFTSANATPARIQTLIRNLEWGAVTGSGTQTFALTLNDADGTANDGDEDTEVDFAMTLGNPPMVSHLNGDEVDFIEGGSPVLLDAGTDATLSDADSPANYNGGNLNATVSSGAAASEDKLMLSTAGSISLKSTTAGSSVAVDGMPIGTLANNITEGNDLQINFNSDATLPRVQKLLRAIQYANNASPVAENSRQVTVTITDNEDLTSSASTITVNTLSRPEASDSRVLLENNSGYSFKSSDFGVSDDGYSIKIESLPVNGTLKLDGSNVSVGDEIELSAIKNRLLTWSDDSDEYGYGYSDFDFKVIDDGDLESAESYMLSIDVGVRTMQLTEGKGWRFLTSPSSDDNYASIFNGVEVDLPPAKYPSFYELDQPTYTWEPVENLSTSTERGKGFIFYGKLGEMPATLSFDGEWTTLSDIYAYDNLDYDENGESTNPGNFYLVGNPHPIALDFCEFTLSDVSETITFWDPITGAGDYISKSCDIEKGIEIAPFQSFWIRTTDVHPTASIPEEAYVNSSSEGYFKEKSSSDADQPLITLNLTSEDKIFSNQLHILFSDEANDGLDPMDAPKLSAEGLVSEWLSFYSMDSEDETYAIQSMPYPDAAAQLSSGDEQNQTLLQIPLNVETTVEGFFKMEWTLGDLSALDADIYLKDNSTGNTIDLNSQNQYSFMLNPTSEKAKVQEQLLLSGNQPFANLTQSEQHDRFTLIVDYGASDQNSVGIDVPEEFALQQNYPNPFNPVTVIQFQLADQSNVELSVYDLTGRQVATLVDKSMQAGNHHVSFNAQDLSSGVYIYTLKAGAQMMSRKLTIVK